MLQWSVEDSEVASWLVEGDLAGRAGESAIGVLVFLVGTWGTQMWGPTMMAARCPRWDLVMLYVDVRVSFNDPFY